MVEFRQILTDRKHKGKIHLQMCIKQLASFSLNHSDVSFFAFSPPLPFQIENTLGLIVLIPCPSQKCTTAWLRGQLQQQNERAVDSFGGKKIKIMCVGFWMCSYSIFFPFFFSWISYLGVKGSLRETGGRLEWGDSLRRGAHADETYLGRPCVHEAPKLPVLKHWLAVSSVSFPWIRKGCCAFHLI